MDEIFLALVDQKELMFLAKTAKTERNQRSVGSLTSQSRSLTAGKKPFVHSWLFGARISGKDQHSETGIVQFLAAWRAYPIPSKCCDLLLYAADRIHRTIRLGIVIPQYIRVPI
jgi:hypothetical protein